MMGPEINQRCGVAQCEAELIAHEDLQVYL